VRGQAGKEKTQMKGGGNRRKRQETLYETPGRKGTITKGVGKGQSDTITRLENGGLVKNEKTLERGGGLKHRGGKRFERKTSDRAYVTIRLRCFKKQPWGSKRN